MAPDEPAFALAPGDIVGGFRLTERLHAGSAQLWAVQRVEARDDGIALVMKLPGSDTDSGGDSDPARIVRFEVEQMILPRLAGPHVPRLVAHGEFSGRPYLVMERIDGESLTPRSDASPLSVDEITAIGRRLATALHDLHRQHVVHLDVTPGQVMFRATGEAVLLGFGLSHHDQMPDLLADEYGHAMGTPSSMSPEQLQFIRNDARSDLFGLGVLLYRLTTGLQPFGIPALANEMRGLRERLYRDPMPPRALRTDCPPWLQEVILRCLEVDPDRRHQSAAQLAFDLQSPERIPLSARAGRMTRRGAWPTMRRWFSTVAQEPHALPAASEQAERHPIMLVALDVCPADHADAAVLEAQAAMVGRVLQTAGDVRLACLTVMQIGTLGLDDAIDDIGNHPQVQLLVRLKHWARGFVRSARGARELRVTFHVLESTDAAAAIVDFASRHQVDQIIIGACSRDGLRRLGGVSSRVVAEAPCSVTVVRHALRS